MKLVQEAEPPSCPRFPFLVGQDGRGNWVVQDRGGVRGGLFVSRADALRYVRSESGNRSHAFVLANEVLELDMTRSPVVAFNQLRAPAKRRERLVAKIADLIRADRPVMAG